MSESMVKQNFLLKICCSISIFIPTIFILLIVNHLFQLTYFQKLQGAPILLAPFAGFMGIILGIISLRLPDKKAAIVGIICNILIIVFPFIYMTLGTIIFGP